jgi:hypothetical protein
MQKPYLGLKSSAARTFRISSLLSFVSVYKRTSLLSRARFHAFLGLPPTPEGGIVTRNRSSSKAELKGIHPEDELEVVAPSCGGGEIEG